MKKTLEANDIHTDRHGRRTAMQLLGAATGAAVVTAIGAPAMAQDDAIPLCSDSDPYDPAGYGRRCGGGSSCSDSDPYDPAGRGRRCYSGGGGGGCSDSDPYDPAGAGRSCGRPTYRSCSDSDPYDPGGHGRHCY